MDVPAVSPVPKDDLPPAAAGAAVPAGDLPSGAAPPAQNPQQDKAIGPLWSPTVRMLSKAVIGAVSIVPDMAADASHLLTGQQYFRESDYWNSILDKYTTKTGGLTEVGEDVGAALLTGGEGEAAAASKAGQVGTQALKKISSRMAEKASAAGYKIPPSYIGGPVARTAQTISGGPKVEKTMSAYNEAVTDRLAKAELGLHEDQELSEHALETLKNEAYKPYDEVRKLGTIPTDDEYKKAIQAAGGRFANRGKSFGGSRFPEIDQEKTPYLQEQFDAGEALDEMRQLRMMSRQNLKNYNPAANAVGYTQREISNALEARIERFADQTGNKGLVERLRASRIQLGKIHSVEDAMGAGGHVRAADLKVMLDKGVPLSGGLKTIAETAREYPRATQHVSEQGQSGTWSAVDYLLGGTGLLHGAPSVGGLVFARPITRWGLATGPVQKKMIQNLSKGPRKPTPLSNLALGGSALGYEDSGSPDDEPVQ